MAESLSEKGMREVDDHRRPVAGAPRLVGKIKRTDTRFVIQKALGDRAHPQMGPYQSPNRALQKLLNQS